MATFTIAPVAVTAGQQKNSAGHALASNVTSIGIQLTDSAGNVKPLAGSSWLTTVGNITQWGVQRSTDGGANWDWFTFQTGLPFKSVDRSGGMPALMMSNAVLAGSAGDQLRLAVVADTNITLGAVVTVN